MTLTEIKEVAFGPGTAPCRSNDSGQQIRLLSLIVLALCSSISITAQSIQSTQRIRPTQTTKYGLVPVSSIADYRRLMAADSNQELVNLKAFIPGIRFDIRYATRHNFMHHPMYTTAGAFLRRPAARALKEVSQELKELGYGLKVFDAYRPYSVTVAFYEEYKDTTFVASPYTGSRHNRGCAVDLTLVDLTTGRDIPMPTPFDSFQKGAAADCPDVSAGQLKDRTLLQRVMLAHGFLELPSEWWHFDFAGWARYPVMDIPFGRL